MEHSLKKNDKLIDLFNQIAETTENPRLILKIDLSNAIIKYAQTIREMNKEKKEIIIDADVVIYEMNEIIFTICALSGLTYDDYIEYIQENEMKNLFKLVNK